MLTLDLNVKKFVNYKFESCERHRVRIYIDFKTVEVNGLKLTGIIRKGNRTYPMLDENGNMYQVSYRLTEAGFVLIIISEKESFIYSSYDC